MLTFKSAYNVIRISNKTLEPEDCLHKVDNSHQECLEEEALGREDLGQGILGVQDSEDLGQEILRVQDSEDLGEVDLDRVRVGLEGVLGDLDRVRVDLGRVGQDLVGVQEGLVGVQEGLEEREGLDQVR